jgi:hypothetical protein
MKHYLYIGDYGIQSTDKFFVVQALEEPIANSDSFRAKVVARNRNATWQLRHETRFVSPLWNLKADCFPTFVEVSLSWVENNMEEISSPEKEKVEESLRETYKALLNVPLGNSWRIRHQQLYAKVRDVLADLEGISPMECQEKYEEEIN